VWIEELDWDDRNAGHVARHGLRPADVEEVWLRFPKFRRNKKGADGHAPDDRAGRQWTVPDGVPGRGRGAARAVAGGHGETRDGDRTTVVGAMVSDEDDVLAHSEDEDEWEDEPVEIERRPSGNQVLSARIPTALANRVFDEAARRGVTMSEVVRTAIEEYFDRPQQRLLNIFPGLRVSVYRVEPAYATTNPVVTPAPEPLRYAV
jgi:hypothetical protein